MPDYGVDKYDIGTGFGHFGIAVDDVSSFSVNIYFLFDFSNLRYISFDALSSPLTILDFLILG